MSLDPVTTSPGWTVTSAFLPTTERRAQNSQETRCRDFSTAAESTNGHSQRPAAANSPAASPVADTSGHSSGKKKKKKKKKNKKRRQSEPEPDSSPLDSDSATVSLARSFSSRSATASSNSNSNNSSDTKPAKHLRIHQEPIRSESISSWPPAATRATASLPVSRVTKKAQGKQTRGERIAQIQQQQNLANDLQANRRKQTAAAAAAAAAAPQKPPPAIKTQLLTTLPPQKPTQGPGFGKFHPNPQRQQQHTFKQQKAKLVFVPASSPTSQVAKKPYSSLSRSPIYSANSQQQRQQQQRGNLKQSSKQYNNHNRQENKRRRKMADSHERNTELEQVLDADVDAMPDNVATTEATASSTTSSSSAASAEAPKATAVVDDAAVPAPNQVGDVVIKAPSKISAESACIVCEELMAVVLCTTCKDQYCGMCFQDQHRKGRRATHQPEPIGGADIGPAPRPCPVETGGDDAEAAAGAAAPTPSPTNDSALLAAAPRPERLSPAWFLDRAKFIPVRLHMKERYFLNLLKSLLAVSDYTSRADNPNIKNEAKRKHIQLQNICALIHGLSLGYAYKDGQLLLEDRNFLKIENGAKMIFEVGRRHKIMNPEKMRTQYGKMVYMLQDAASEEARNLLRFSCVKPIETVYTFLERKNAIRVLADVDMRIATQEILPDGKTRQVIQRDIKEKERAIERISKRYCTHDLTRDEIKWCIYSINDNHSFLTANRKPIDTMITWLTDLFDPESVEDGYSLAISADGTEGHRLTHNHSRHYHYVLQSLTLWREITDDMFRLWCLAEEDLLDSSVPYKLVDTGQGVHRLKAAPRIMSAMRTILHNTQKELGSWIGSSVIHLGDSNVPNALLFIDKYTQIARILTPIITAVKEVRRMSEKDEKMKDYFASSFGGARKLEKDLLYDFFKNAFDGSGADNFFDAGSCIDGRLTSAWNWCSQLEQKDFFPVFKLSGFVGFDGEFQE